MYIRDQCREDNERKHDEGSQRREYPRNKESGEHSLICLQLNWDHLQSKGVELEEFLKKYKIDIAIQESKLRCEDKKVAVRGYNILRKDQNRENKKILVRIERLCFYIKHGISYQETNVDNNLSVSN